jgi:hypothetical protein
MADTTELADVFEAALSTNDFRSIMDLLKDRSSDDFVQEWPQSGERLTRDNSLRLAEVYGERSGAEPSFTAKRMLRGGDIFVVEGTVDYGDGVPVSYVGIAEVRDGKIARMTEYFANPFPAPEWRAEFVEKG